MFGRNELRDVIMNINACKDEYQLGSKVKCICFGCRILSSIRLTWRSTSVFCRCVWVTTRCTWGDESQTPLKSNRWKLKPRKRRWPGSRKGLHRWHHLYHLFILLLYLSMLLPVSVHVLPIVVLPMYGLLPASLYFGPCICPFCSLCLFILLSVSVCSTSWITVYVSMLLSLSVRSAQSPILSPA